MMFLAIDHFVGEILQPRSWYITKEMAASTPLLEHWVSAYRNDHRGRPLLDIGCAYGRNVLAAAQRLEGSRSDGTEAGRT
jgi:hypothetical protein